MNKYLDVVKQVAFATLVQRVANWMVEQYVMPHVEKLPTKKSKPFGFHSK